jgi:hypothetical protein
LGVVNIHLATDSDHLANVIIDQEIATADFVVVITNLAIAISHLEAATCNYGAGVDHLEAAILHFMVAAEVLGK